MSRKPSATGRFPRTRMRRMRKDEFSRRLMRETRLSADDLIQPLFVIDGQNKSQAVASMPGIQRLSIDRLLAQAEGLLKLGVPAVALFPVVGRGQEIAQCQRSAQRQGAGAARGARA